MVSGSGGNQGEGLPASLEPDRARHTGRWWPSEGGGERPQVGKPKEGGRLGRSGLHTPPRGHTQLKAGWGTWRVSDSGPVAVSWWWWWWVS